MLLPLRRFTSLSVLVLASLGVATACSSSEGDPKPGAGNNAPSTTRISAEKGGTVSDPSGTATLTIPPGALAEDTDISLAVSAATADTLTSIFDFGPDGLSFIKPVTLDVKVDAAKIGDKQVAVALETNGKFVPLAGSTYADGKASAPIEHFSKFSVVFVEGKAVSGACDEAVAAFQACGGDIKGTWIIEDFCFAGINDLPDEECPESKMTIEVEYHGVEFTFGEGGVFSQSEGTVDQARKLELPLSCAEGSESCASLSTQTTGTCTGDEVCTCTQSLSFPSEAEEGTYTIEGYTVSVVTEEESGEAQEYCVKGDKLQLRAKGAKGTESTLLTFRRK